LSAAKSEGISGLVVVDKEAGLTSHDVVSRCRRLFGQRRVGHAGTLDPDATGVLLVGLGRFTRGLRFLTELEKCYSAEVVFGASTSSQDSSGTVIESFVMEDLSPAMVQAAADKLTGPIMQIPPMVSAIRVDGRRLHELAREGKEVERQPRPVKVTSFATEPTDDPLVYGIKVSCSSGTYVRTLAHDLGIALGGGAHLRNLRRTAIGAFDETRAETLAVIEARVDATPILAAGTPPILSPAEALRELGWVVVDAPVPEYISNGRPLDRVAIGASGPGPWAIVDRDHELLAVYEATETDRIKPAVVFHAAT